MSDDTIVDVETLRSQVRDKYRDVALDPHGTHHFHTGRRLAVLLGYDSEVVDGLTDRAVERRRPSGGRTHGTPTPRRSSSATSR